MLLLNRRVIGDVVKKSRYFCTAQKHPINICIIGSGPAGFYTAQHLLQNNDKLCVDMYEKTPVPYGLVRYGVAPDHPEVKNVVATFQRVAKNDRFNFMGNVSVGKDVSLDELRDAYHAVVLCYGASKERKLGISNEELVISAQNIVGWYNGTEEDSQLKLNLDIEDVAVIGHGNVALDVARMFLLPVKLLKETDISEHALEALSKSRIKRVHVIGRRGPLQVAFTLVELREVLELQGCRPVLTKSDFEPLKEIISKLPRQRKRLTEFMYSKAMRPMLDTNESKQFHLLFKRTPLEIITKNGTQQISKLKLAVNELEEVNNSVIAKVTDTIEELSCGMVVRSVGYLGHSLDPKIPFDAKKGIVINMNGKVMDHPGVYCSGWIRSGPVGVIAFTMNDSQDTGETILHDVKNKIISLSETKTGRSKIENLLKSKGVQTVSFSEWEKIDAVEQERGKQKGKCREKILNHAEMLRIAKT